MSQVLEVVNHAFRDHVLLGPYQAAGGNGSFIGFMASRLYNLSGISIRYQATSASGTVDVTQDHQGTSPGGGTSVLTGTISTSNGPTVNLQVAGTLTSNPITISQGDCLTVKLAGTITGLTNLIVIANLQPTGV